MIVAVVLAAGEALRLGRPKPLLAIDGEPLLARCLRMLRSVPMDRIVVVLGHAAEEVRQQVPLEGVTVVTNPRYREGMSTSLVAGLAAVGPEAEAALIVPADQPFLTVSVIRELIDCYRMSKQPIVLPAVKGRRGTPVLLGRELFPEARSLEGDVGFRALFPRHRGQMVKVDVGDPWILMDIDTAEDYARAVQHASAESAP